LRKFTFTLRLTEGLISSIINEKNDFKIISTYVNSKLNWGIVKSKNNKDLKDLKDLNGKIIGVSRQF
jgi:hypothetical protein